MIKEAVAQRYKEAITKLGEEITIIAEVSGP